MVLKLTFVEGLEVKRFLTKVIFSSLLSPGPSFCNKVVSVFTWQHIDFTSIDNVLFYAIETVGLLALNLDLVRLYRYMQN